MNCKQFVKILLVKFLTQLRNYHASFILNFLERTLLKNYYSETCLIRSLCDKVTGLSQLT